MKAYIKQDTKNSKALWLIVETEDKPAEIETIMGTLRTEDSAGNVAYAIVEEEVEAIRDACDKWLDTPKREYLLNIQREQIHSMLGRIYGSTDCEECLRTQEEIQKIRTWLKNNNK